MTNDSTSTNGTAAKREGIARVVAVTVAWVIGKAVDDATMASLGYWGAFAAGLITAGVVAAVVYGIVRKLRVR